MVLVQKWPFFLPFLGGFIGQKNVFYDTIKRKNAFLGYKNKKFKKSKNWHFSKGLTDGFGAKIAIFPRFFFRKYKPGRCVVRYSATASKAIKTKSSKIQNIEIFPKG